MQERSTTTAPAGRVGAGEDFEEWLVPLRASGPAHDLAVQRLHALLLRAARFEAARRSPHPMVGARELEDLTCQAADDALISILSRLDTFRGASRFTTWAYKFAVYEMAVKLRRRAWQDREVSLELERWDLLSGPELGPLQGAEYAELLSAVRSGIVEALTPHQRHVLVALALNGVPIDVLAERLGTTRGALYKTLHDARHKLRSFLAGRGLDPATPPQGEAP